MDGQPTIEELQAQILEANKKQEELNTKLEAMEKESSKTKEELANARKINAELWLNQKGGPSPHSNTDNTDDSEELTPEKAMDALLDDALIPNFKRLKGIYGDKINTEIIKE